jgi:hypothetical protein
MDTLPKLKKLPTAWLYSVVYRTLLGAMLAYYLAEMVGKPLLQQLLFFTVLAVLTVVVEQWPRGLFKPYAARVQQGVISLLGQQFELAKIEGIQYEFTHQYYHTLQIKMQGYLPAELQLTQPDYLENNRLLNFLRQHYPTLKVVDALNR